MRVFIGTDSDQLAFLQERASAAYREGCNTIDAVANGGFHSYAVSFYARRARTGRRVDNPSAWLAQAQARENAKAAWLWKLSREG